MMKDFQERSFKENILAHAHCADIKSVSVKFIKNRGSTSDGL